MKFLTKMSKIVFCLIANDNSSTPLGQISLEDGNFAQIAVKLLEKAKGESNFSKSYSCDKNYIFHFHNRDGISVLCLTTSNYSNRHAYSFLFEIRDKVLSTYGAEISNMIAFSIQKSFMDEIREIIKKYNTEDKLMIVNRNVNEVKEIMVENLEKILQRGEKIEVLVQKSEALKDNAVVFNKQAKSVKVHFLCKNIKITIVISAILVLVLAAVIILACGGFDFNKCR